MKLLGFMLVCAGLIGGMFVAASAYVVSVDSIDPAAGDRVTLHAPAGKDPADPTKPVLLPGTLDNPRILTTADIEMLKQAGTAHVHVKEFSWSRWRGRWWFLLCCVALIGGAVLLRIGARRQLQALTAGGGGAFVSPPKLLADARAGVQSLLADLNTTASAEARRELIIHRLDGIAAQQLEPFVAARSQLVGALGMAGYAQLMDRFAGSERAINRAWSAAADNDEIEAINSLERAIVLLDETAKRLPGSAF